MLHVLLIAQLLTASRVVIHSSAPPLTPAEAAAIVARLPPPTNMTNVVFAPRPLYPPSPVVIVKPAPAPVAQVVFRPLNCCAYYADGFAFVDRSSFMKYVRSKHERRK